MCQTDDNRVWITKNSKLISPPFEVTKKDDGYHCACMKHSVETGPFPSDQTAMWKGPGILKCGCQDIFYLDDYLDIELKAWNGWLNPEGKLYSCGRMGHIAFAYNIGMGEATMEKAWVKLSRGFWLVSTFRITQSQLDTIFDWSKKHEINLPKWIGKVKLL